MIRKIKYIKLLLNNPVQFKNIMKRYLLTKVFSRFTDSYRTIYPTSITWAITGKCNYNCVYCGVKNYYMGSDIKPDLGFDQIKQIIDNMKKYPTKILLIGGEPLIRKDLFDIMKYLKKSNLKFSLFTNAGLITEKNVDMILDSGLEEISISFDGKNHSNICGVRDAFELTMNGISLLSKRKLERGQKTPRLRLVSTLTPKFKERDYELLLSIAEKNNGINEVSLNNLIFDSHEIGTRKLNLQERFLERFNIARIEKWYNEKKTTFTPKGLSKEFVKDWYSFNTPSKESRCIAPFNTATLLSSGQLTQCFFLDSPLGNLIENDLSKIWDSKDALSVRKRIKNKKFEKECFRCCLIEPRFDKKD